MLITGSYAPAGLRGAVFPVKGGIGDPTGTPFPVSRFVFGRAVGLLLPTAMQIRFFCRETVLRSAPVGLGAALPPRPGPGPQLGLRWGAMWIAFAAAAVEAALAFWAVVTQESDTSEGKPAGSGPP